MFNNPNKSIYYVINPSNTSEALSMLKKYLEYEWYETHKSEHVTYSGYWSFEIGVIAKSLKIDDSILKDTSYYPYDMVQYREK
ncbi:PoNe immunity protein domain-containing protein [Bacillus mycoides]|uniref:PoNe immunity protein domain-containing protein n=1 Tax=Bacillus mycoides TaxID=1405 RepID=UPI003D645E2D